MTNMPDTLAMAKKASARGVAHAEEALRNSASPEVQERQILVAAAYFTVATGLMKVRIAE